LPKILNMHYNEEEDTPNPFELIRKLHDTITSQKYTL